MLLSIRLHPACFKSPTTCARPIVFFQSSNHLHSEHLIIAICLSNRVSSAFCSTRYGSQSSDSFIDPVLKHIAFRMAVAAMGGGFVGAFTSLWTTLALLDISLDQFYSVVRCGFPNSSW